MTDEEDFHHHLDAHPDDYNARMVFADFLEERGDPRAEGYRALGMMRKRPYSSGGYFHYGGDHGIYSPYPPYAHLTNEWAEKINSLAGGYAGHTRRGAEDKAALAFSQLPPERREELLRTNQQYSRRVKVRKLARSMK